ncbi:AlpA family phage regulatory protein [Hyphomicrobium sp. GJ21]|uniref:AlpA family phage regulatory protein n=1 Tax=Hyphomicrobium sp. GJ21 TaxID=113574 RepID=UPI0009FEC247
MRLKNSNRPGRSSGPSKTHIAIEEIKARLEDKRQPAVFLSARDVVRRTTLSRAQIYRMVSQGTFPNPVAVSPGRRVWVDAEVSEWMKKIVDERTYGWPS